jgi:hypothetical protein
MKVKWNKFEKNFNFYWKWNEIEIKIQNFSEIEMKVNKFFSTFSIANAHYFYVSINFTIVWIVYSIDSNHKYIS